LETGFVPQAPVVFVPGVVHLSGAALAGLRQFKGRVVLVGGDDELARDEYGHQRRPSSLLLCLLRGLLFVVAMIRIDGSAGEGGGQILRTALALSLVTGQAFRMEHVRAKRQWPGRLRQRLTVVDAARTVGGRW
jgi:hypothetical protein